MRITGHITAWFPRGYGYVAARQNTPQGQRTVRYFLHVSKIVGMPDGLLEPVVGCSVEFEVTNNHKRKVTDIPSAIDAIVGPPTPVASGALQALAGGQ